MNELAIRTVWGKRGERLWRPRHAPGACRPFLSSGPWWSHCLEDPRQRSVCGSWFPPGAAALGLTARGRAVPTGHHGRSGHPCLGPSIHLLFLVSTSTV